MQRTTRVLLVVAGSFLLLTAGYWYFSTGRRNKDTLPSTLTPSGLAHSSSGSMISPPDTRPGGTKPQSVPLPPHPFTHPAKREDLWVDVSKNEDTLIRRMGYIDDRFPSDGSFLVLLLMHNEQKKKPSLFAKINYKDNPSVCLPLQYWLQSGHLDLKHNLPEIYVNRVLRTKGKLRFETPSSVQVTSDHQCNTGLSVDIPVRWNSREVSSKSVEAVKYGVCIHKALFGIKDPQMLVDWIEIHKALGVQKMLVYLENVPESIPEAVGRYVKDGTLDLFDWGLDKRTRDFGQSGVMTECHYHFLHNAEYVGTYDLDEVVISNEHKTWHDMFNELSKKHSDYNKIGSFLLNGLRWHNDFNESQHFPGHETLCPKMKTPFYFMKTLRERKAWDHPKVIIRPVLTRLVQVHSAFTVKGAKGIRLSSETVTCHHYRREKEGREHVWENAYFNDVMKKYEEEVVMQVKKTMCSSQ